MKYTSVEEIQKKLVLISEVPDRAKTLEDYEISELLNYIDNTLEDSLIYGLPNTLFYRGGEQCFELDQVYGGDLEKFESDGYQYVRGIILEAKGSVEPDVQNNTPTIEDIRELNTPEAKKIIDQATKAGFISHDASGFKWKGTRPQLALFAELASEQLSLKNKYTYFQLLFGVKNLAQERNKSVNIMGKVNRQDDIYSIFE